MYFSGGSIENLNNLYKNFIKNQKYVLNISVKWIIIKTVMIVANSGIIKYNRSGGKL